MSTKLTATFECPSNEELRQLACGHLQQTRHDALENHIGHCPECQSRLEDVATQGDRRFTGSVRNITKAVPPKDSAYWSAIGRVEMDVTGTRTTLPAVTTTLSSEYDLSFLQPSTNKASIGKIGPFDVIDELGRGGMGIVLRAYDESLKREVAVKVLDRGLTNNVTARERFCREAQAAAKLTHENIVGVYQVSSGTDGGLPYIVMQLVNGQTLEKRLKDQGKLSVEEVVRVGAQTAAGLAAAHAQQLIHRDIKPGNILIEAGTNKIKLTDFGLARAEEDSKLTRTGFVAGTPLYMAPEQARGEEVDARSDLFSLGSVLYESLAGRPPFDGKTPLIVLRRLADEKHEPLHKLNPAVPVWLEDVINKLLAKDPAKRYQTAAELRDELASQLDCLKSGSQEHVAACPLPIQPSLWRNLSRDRLKQRLLAAAAASFLVGTIAGGVGTWAFGPRREAAQPGQVGPKEVSMTLPQTSAVWSLTSTPDGSTIIAGMEDGQVILWDLKNSETITNLFQHDGPVWSTDISRDGKMLVTSSDDGTVKVWDITTGKAVVDIDNKTSVRSAALNQSRTHVVTGDRKGFIRVWAISEPKQHAKEFPYQGVINAVAFRPVNEGQQPVIAAGSTNRTALLWKQEKPMPESEILRGHKGPIYSLAYSPDGKILATASWDHDVMLWDVDTGRKLGRVKNAHEEGIWSIAFAPCSKILATAGQDGLVKVWHIDELPNEDSNEQAKPIMTLSRHKGTVHAVHFTDDGKHLITGGRDGTIRLWKMKE